MAVSRHDVETEAAVACIDPQTALHVAVGRRGDGREAAHRGMYSHVVVHDEDCDNGSDVFMAFSFRLVSVCVRACVRARGCKRDFNRKYAKNNTNVWSWQTDCLKDRA